MKTNETRFWIVGDLCPLGYGMTGEITDRRPLFDGVQSLVKDSPIIANLECPLTNLSCGRPFKWANLRANPEVASLLQGMSMAVLANNHISDYGAESARETMTLLNKLSIKHVGYGGCIQESLKPAFLKLDGRTLGVVALCCPTTNGENLATHMSEGVAPLSMGNIAEAILRVRNSCDALIAYFHWGCEWVHDPVPDQLRMARYAIQCGADAVIGCHSHTIQSYEQYRGRWIFYGLGNFLFGPGEAIETLPNGESKHHPLRSDAAQRESLAVTFSITEDTGEGRLQLEKIQPLRCGEDFVPVSIQTEELSFDLAAHCKVLADYVERHAMELQNEEEPAFRSVFRNGVLAFFYQNKPITGNLSVPIARRSYAQFTKACFKRVLRHVPGARTANRLRLELRHKPARIEEKKLAARIRQKWIQDSKHLPLTPEHWELYDIIHRRLLGELGEFPELVNCRDFNDRIQWLKLFDQDPEMIRCSDKILVRDYVREHVGEQYLTKLYQTCGHFHEIDFDALPKSFVIKTNHDSGTVVLVRDKNRMDLKVLRARFEESLRRPYGCENGEWAYPFVRPRLLIEEFIEPMQSSPPPDYKFYVVEGRVKFVHFIYDRGVNTKEQTVSPMGEDLKTALYPSFELGHAFKTPHCWDDMKIVAEQLGNGFKCVRVDLFESQGRIYAGEMTFWPMFGAYKGDGQKKIGQLLDFDRTTFREPILHKLKAPWDNIHLGSYVEKLT